MEISIHPHYAGTRYGFKHVANLFVNGSFVESATVQYYNRTWECYQFQTVKKAVIRRYIDRLTAAAIEAYKGKTGRKRLSADVKKQIAGANTAIQELTNYYNTL